MHKVNLSSCRLLNWVMMHRIVRHLLMSRADLTYFNKKTFLDNAAFTRKVLNGSNMPMYASFCYNLILHFHLIKYKDYASYAEGCKTFLTRFYKSSYIALWLQKYKSFNNIYDHFPQVRLILR